MLRHASSSVYSTGSDNLGAQNICRGLSSISSTSSEVPIHPGEELLRKFHESQPRRRTKVQMDIPCVKRGKKEFPTGSKYVGYWNLLGICGYGVYTYPVSGVKYEGDFEDGLFHGEGQFIYPSGVRLKGLFRNGVMMTRTVIFADGVEYKERDWEYCVLPDRRFPVEHDFGIPPAGESLLSADAELDHAVLADQSLDESSHSFITSKAKLHTRPRGNIRNPTRSELQRLEETRSHLSPLAVGPAQELYEEWLAPALRPPRPPPAKTEARGWDGCSEHSFSGSEAQYESCVLSYASTRPYCLLAGEESSSRLPRPVPQKKTALELRRAQVSAMLHASNAHSGNTT